VDLNINKGPNMGTNYEDQIMRREHLLDIWTAKTTLSQ